MSKDIETVVKDQDLIARRHAQISDAALKLFSQKGYHRTTVREIALASGLGIGTLYSYIKKKEDMLTIVYRRILARFEERMREATEGIQDPRLQLQAAIEGTLRVYDEFEDAVVLLYRESHALDRQTLQSLFDVDRNYVGLFRAILERGTHGGHFAVEEPHLMAVSILFLCAVWNLKRWNLKGYSLETVIQGLTSLILDGIAGDKATGEGKRWGTGVLGSGEVPEQRS